MYAPRSGWQIWLLLLQISLEDSESWGGLVRSGSFGCRRFQASWSPFIGHGGYARRVKFGQWRWFVPTTSTAPARLTRGFFGSLLWVSLPIVFVWLPLEWFQQTGRVRDTYCWTQRTGSLEETTARLEDGCSNVDSRVFVCTRFTSVY